MNPVLDIRRANLSRVLKERGGAAKVAVALGLNASYLSQLTGKARFREISEKVARDLEDRLGLLPQYLDNPDPQQPEQTVAGAFAALGQALSASSSIAPDKVGELAALIFERVSNGEGLSVEHIRRLVRLASQRVSAQPSAPADVPAAAPRRQGRG